jgi:hypothetical protein
VRNRILMRDLAPSSAAMPAGDRAVMPGRRPRLTKGEDGRSAAGAAGGLVAGEAGADGYRRALDPQARPQAVDRLRRAA